MDKLVSASGFNKEITEFDSILNHQNARQEADGEEEEEEESDEEEEYETDDDECNTTRDHNGDEYPVSDEDNKPDDNPNVSADKDMENNIEENKGNEFGDEIKPMDATFNATMNMFFQSLGQAGVSGVTESPLTCCTKPICNNECFSQNKKSHQLALVPEDEICENLSAAQIIDDANPQPSTSRTTKCDNFDTASVTSSRRSKKKNGQKLDDETRQAIKEKLLESRRMRREAREKGEEIPQVAEFLESSKHDDDKLSCFSFSTNATTIDPAVIEKRMAREYQRIEMKQVDKKRLRAKGEANASTRQNKENSLNIKQTMECQDVWG